MADVLIVVDSTAKAEFMQDYFGDRADCVVCSWPLLKTTHQIAPSAAAGPTFHFERVAGGEECVAALHAHHRHDVMVAFDANARADYLAWQIRGYLAQIGGSVDTVKQLSIPAFIEEEFDAALSVARPVAEQQGVSYYYRLLFDECLARHLVRLVGTDRGPENFPLRQPSLTTLFLLAERERELGMFVPAPKWQVQAELAVNEKIFTASLSKGIDLPADGLLRDEGKALIIRDQVSHLPFVVDAVHRSPLTINPPQPYLLAELVHDAKVILGINPAATMAMVRKLYHGILIDGRPTGVISSYSPSTGEPSDDILLGLREHISALYGDSAPAEESSIQAGMIVPLNPELTGVVLKEGLSDEEAALYELIRARALASQMRPAVGETIKVDFKVGKKSAFQAHFNEFSELGFLQGAPQELSRIQIPCPVPDIQAGQEFSPRGVRCQQIRSEGLVAERYTIETLFASLADFSIAADPITMAMLDAMIKAGYVTISTEGNLHAATNTAKVVALLDRAFPRMQGVNLSAYIEQTVAEAISGRKDLLFALKQFEQTLMLHGKCLVKAKIASKIPLRTRTSTTIIKQVAPSREEEVAAGTQDAATPLPAEPQPTLESTAAETPSPVSQAVESADSPQTTDLGALPEAGTPEESLPPETTDEIESAFESEDGDQDALWPKFEQETALPDDLKKVFADVLLSQSPPANESVEALASPSAREESAAAKAAPQLEQERLCPVCGRAMLLKEDTFGPFWGCSGFPGCRYSEAVAQADKGLACPLCGQGLNRKQTPTGKSFYVCVSSDCQFMSWSKPHYLPCGLCDSPYLVEKLVHGVNRLRCPRAGCPYEQTLTGGGHVVAKAAAADAPVKKKVLVRRAVSGGVSAGGGATKKVRVVRRKK